MAPLDVTILNHHNGQVLEVKLGGPVDPQSWPVLEGRLLTLVQVRQPVELRLDVDGVGGLPRFPAGLAALAAALAAVGGKLTTTA